MTKPPVDGIWVAPKAADRVMIESIAGFNRKTDPFRPATVLEWAQRYRRLNGRPFSLDQFRPLEELYTDFFRHTVIIKPAQRGISEYAVNLACYWLDAAWKLHDGLDGVNIGYFFPTDDDVKDFTKERIEGILEEHPHLTQMLGGGKFDSLSFKQIGRSYFYLRGGTAIGSVKTVKLDGLLLDEFDDMPTHTVPLVRKRMIASSIGFELDFSTPSLPGVGIDAAYKATDQRVWLNHCFHCNTWTQLQFHRDVRANMESFDVWQYWSEIMLETAEYTVHCPECQHAIDPCGEGRWEAQQPEFSHIRRGYHIPALAYPFVNYPELAKGAVSPNPEVRKQFWNSDIGMPYQPGATRVTLDMLRQLTSKLHGGEVPTHDGLYFDTVMGVDVGKQVHYKIVSKRFDGLDFGLFTRAMGHCQGGTEEGFAEIERRMDEFNVRQCVIDHQPETVMAGRLQQRFPGRVLLARFPMGAHAMKGILMRLPQDEHGEPVGLIDINRNMGCDAVFDMIIHAAENWPRSIVENPEVQAHMTAMQRITKLDGNGNEMAVWLENGPNHLWFATLYCLIAYMSLPDVLYGVTSTAGARAVA